MKLQFYVIRVLFFSLLLSVGWGGAVNAQTISLDMRNRSNGGSGFSAFPGHVIEYTITYNSGPETNMSMIAYIPAGTVYEPGSTTFQGYSVPDVNGNMPYTYGVSVIPNTDFTVTYKVRVTANLGNVTNRAALFVPNTSFTWSNQTVTTITTTPYCDRGYMLATRNTSGIKITPPYTIWPYEYSRYFDPAQNMASDRIYGGTTALCKDAYTNADLPAGSILKEGTAIAQVHDRMRLYFVNKPVNGVAADLCYLDLEPTNGVYIAKRYTGTPLIADANETISRMTFDGLGNGYALTESGKLIRFKINASTNLPAIEPAVTLSNDINNPYDVLTETEGDICADGSGKLIFIANSGHVYYIDPVTKVAAYRATITGMPAEGCRAIAADFSGYLYMGGFYEKLYRITPSTWTATVVSTLYWATTDFSSCMLPVTQARTATNENTVPAVQPPLTAEVYARVIPNPFMKELNVQIKLNTAEVVKVRLTDFYGRTVFTSTEKLGAGANSLHLTVPDGLGAGMYVLELWAGNNRLLQKKLLKQ
jgi:hypothetical protein